MHKLTNILLVEDNEAHVELILRAFDTSLPDCSVNTCKNIRQARKAITAGSPQLIITDLNLPDGKGLQLLAEEKQQPYPIILMTSYGDENIAVEAMKSGAYDYMVKSPEAFEAMPRSAERVFREWSNITDKLKIQRELQDKEHDQAEILNSMMDSVITTNEDGAILSFNKAAESLFGITAIEAIGSDIGKLIESPPLPNDHKDTLGIPNSVEISSRKNSNQVFPMRLAVVELSKGADGKRRFINSCHDLSHEKFQEEQLRHSQKMQALGKLTGGVVHDYNNMLNVVLGYSELLAGLLVDEPVLLKYVNEIHRAGERSAQLTTKLLAFSRYKTSNAAPLNMNSMLTEQQDMLKRTLTARIALKFELDAALWNILVDNNDLGDTILNLCINAMHAIEGQGKLVIQTANTQLNHEDAAAVKLRAGEYTTLCITDTGCGMNEETIEKIFDPFYSTKGESGTGLGLSQVYGFIERSHGVIDVESNLNKGTKFILYFPRHIGSVKNVDQPVINTPHHKGEETILIVDDEPALLNLSTEILRKSGYNVIKTGNPKHALKLLESSEVALLISDIIMPEMNGYELSAIVQEKYPTIKIQLASGYAENENADIVSNELHRNMLLKPYTAHQLLEKIRILLNENTSIPLQKNSNTIN